jgi:hypothetical protein
MQRLREHFLAAPFSVYIGVIEKVCAFLKRGGYEPLGLQGG